MRRFPRHSAKRVINYLNALSPSLMACSVSFPTCSLRKVSSLTLESVPRQLVSMDTDKATLATNSGTKSTRMSSISPGNNV